MVANLIDGKLLANEIRSGIKQKIEALGEDKPCLSIILVGNHPASEIYVRNKQKACEEVGIKFVLNHFPQEVSIGTVLSKIKELNEDPNIHGILVQMPLPSHFNQFDIINSISPTKDVEVSFSTTNSMFNLNDPFECGKIMGRLITPKAFMLELQLLKLALGMGNK